MIAPAPIVLFAYRRPDLLQRTLDALAANELADKTEITIFCNAPHTEDEKNQTDAVRVVARNVRGFSAVHVIERSEHLGCSASFIDGLTQMFAQHERLIVMEDDILSSPYMLRYLNDALEFYEDKKTVFTVHAWSPPPSLLHIPKAYPYDVYAVPRFHCWGWASWRDRFERIEWEITDYEEFCHYPGLQKSYMRGGKDMLRILQEKLAGTLDTWDILLDYTRFKQGTVGINPVVSYTTNIGMGSGTHTTEHTTRFDCDIRLAKKNYRFSEYVFMDADIISGYKNIFSRGFFDVCKSFFAALRNKGIWYTLRRTITYLCNK